MKDLTTATQEFAVEDLDKTVVVGDAWMKKLLGIESIYPKDEYLGIQKWSSSLKAKSTSLKTLGGNLPTLVWKRQKSITNGLQKFGAALDMEISPQLPAFDWKAGNSRMALGQSWIPGWRSSAWKGTCRLRHFQVPGKDVSNWVNFWRRWFWTGEDWCINGFLWGKQGSDISTSSFQGVTNRLFFESTLTSDANVHPWRIWVSKTNCWCESLGQTVYSKSQEGFLFKGLLGGVSKL